MWIQDICDLYFMQVRAELTGVNYVILENFADPMQFLKKILNIAGLPGNYQKKSLHAFMA